MFKKILLASSILALTSSVALAAAAPYVGASIGVTANTASAKIFGKNVGVGSYRGMPFDVFAGYGGIVTQSFYLAGEVTGTVVTADLSASHELKTTYGYGLSIIPGVMLSDHTLAYARAGVVRSRFSEANSTRTGGQFGLGLQTSLTQNIDLRGEYDFVAYQSFKGKTNGVSWSLAPRSDQFNLGVIYKFE